MRSRAKLLIPAALSQLGDPYLAVLSLLLLAYALAGKGVAYLSLGPLYVGDVILILGLAVLVFTRGALRPMGLGLAWGLLLFVLLGLVRMLANLGDYGLLALRDSVIWGYAMFAFLVAGLLAAQPRRLAMAVDRLGWLARWYPLIVLPFWYAQLLFYDRLPRTPGTELSIFYQKGGDIIVHLTGALALISAGYVPAGGWLWYVAFLVVLASTAVARGAMLALLGGLIALALLRRLNRGIIRLLGLIALALALLAISGLTIKVPHVEREISFQQFTDNVLSVVGMGNGGNLAGTRNWRLGWWWAIVQDTFRGFNFWIGQGFGINLADAYGYQVDAADSLRSPHSIHLTVLARMGVPGLVVWLGLHATWAISLFAARRRARKLGHKRWAGLFAVLLVYALAFLINGSFDVYLEGPVGGIWFWTIYGIGLAALWIYRHQPEILAEPQPQEQVAESLQPHAPPGRRFPRRPSTVLATPT